MTSFFNKINFHGVQKGKRPKGMESTDYLRASRAYKRDCHLDLGGLQKHLGMDGATLYAHLFFSRSPSTRRYEKLLKQLDTYNSENKNYEIIIPVPDSRLGFSSRSDKIAGQMAHLSVGCGFSQVHRVQLRFRSALEGARQLFDFIRNRRVNRPIIFLSFSHSSASVRILLDRLEHSSLGSSPSISIHAWVNVSGLIFGSPAYFISQKRRFFHSENSSLLYESFSCEQSYFRKPLSNRSLKRVHLLSMKTQSQMSWEERRKVDLLKHWGPSDGFVPYGDYQRLTDPILSFLGQSHFLDLDSIPLTFSKVLCSVSNPNFPRALPGRDLEPSHGVVDEVRLC